MKRLRNVLLTVSVIVMVFCIASVQSFAAEILESGECGENLTWTFDSEGTLTISGTGEMADYEGYNSYETAAPWHRSFLKIKNIVISEGVTGIGDAAFRYCRDISDIKIPHGVTSIGKDAFSNCHRLETVTIPPSVEVIGEEAFYSCEDLQKVYISSLEKWFSVEFADDYYSNPLYCYADLYLNGKKLTEVTIPSGITTVGTQLRNCTSIKNVIVPSDVTAIAKKAFSGCGNLESITLPGSITTIDEEVFRDCSKLKSIDIPEGVVSVSFSAFESCTSLQKVSFPDSLKYIGEYSFKNCSAIKKLVIPDGVTKIGHEAFNGCRSLTSVTIPQSVKSIGWWAFENCDKLKTVNIENLEKWLSVKTTSNPLQNGADLYLNGKKVTDVTVPSDIKTIGTQLNGCTSIVSVIISEGVRKIDDWAFSGCINLKKVIISEGATSIGKYAFVDCTSLQSVTIPKSMKTINDMAFSDCKNIKDVYYGGTKAQWKNIKISETCGGLTNAEIHYACEHKNTVKKAKVNSTCSKIGYTEGVYCKDCKKYISGHKKIAINASAHTFESLITPATFTKNGVIKNKCTLCGYVSSKTTTIYSPWTITLSKTEYTYNGKVQTSSVTVKDSKGNALKKDTDYTVKYESGRKLPGTYTVTITFKGNYSGTKKLTYTIAPKATSKVTATQTLTTITLKWNKVTGADGYRIYQYNTKTKKYEKVKDVTGTSLKISNLKSGTKYKFKVRAYTKDDGTIMGAYSSVFETATKAKTPTLKATSTKKGAASLSWTNVTGESGYQVYYATKKNGEFKKLDSYKVNVVKATASRLTSGKTYYFKVRAYTKTDSGTVYSAWSTVKSVKVK